MTTPPANQTNRQLAQALTVRQNAERLKERHRHWANDLTHGHFCRHCGWSQPCPDYVDAQAILDALGAAAVVHPALSMQRGRERASSLTPSIPGLSAPRPVPQRKAPR